MEYFLGEEKNKNKPRLKIVNLYLILETQLFKKPERSL